MAKKPKKELTRLIKVSTIECTNGNCIVIGQRRRKTETEPIVWEYEVQTINGYTLFKGERENKIEAFNEALNKATNCHVHINPEQTIKENVMVRWEEFPDRLYIVKETNVSHCGHNDYCKIETVDKAYRAVVPISQLTLDDVDYVDFY